MSNRKKFVHIEIKKVKNGYIVIDKRLIKHKEYVTYTEDEAQKLVNKLVRGNE